MSNMVKGYICNTHGYVTECDVTTDGQRICPDCGDAVTGLTGRTRGRRAPPSDDPSFQQGDIRWTVTGRGGTFTVRAFDFADAAEAAVDVVESPQAVSRIQPSDRQYRGK